jgi:hypothetical protein
MNSIYFLKLSRYEEVTREFISRAAVLFLAFGTENIRPTGEIPSFFTLFEICFMFMLFVKYLCSRAVGLSRAFTLFNQKQLTQLEMLFFILKNIIPVYSDNVTVAMRG